MHRFIVEAGLRAGCVAALGADDARHALRVLRLRAGDRVQLSDGVGALFEAVLERADDAGVYARVGDRLPSGEPGVRVTIYQGLPKADKLDLIVQKATELGAARVVPVKMERSVVRLDEKDGEKRRQRLSKIAREAAKQCGRACVTEVLAPVGFERALDMLSREDAALMPWENAREDGFKRAWSERPDAASVGILIGPEGGISEAEASRAIKAGAMPVTLGPRILRTETAAIVCCALAMHLWGDI